MYPKSCLFLSHHVCLYCASVLKIQYFGLGLWHNLHSKVSGLQLGSILGAVMEMQHCWANTDQCLSYTPMSGCVFLCIFSVFQSFPSSSLFFILSPRFVFLSILSPCLNILSVSLLVTGDHGSYL